MDEVIKIYSAEENKIRPFHSANSLFHFMGKIEHLEEIIKLKAYIPRYCTEDVSFLNVSVDNKKILNVAYPEKCFCDIPFHNLLSHKSTYGSFGIGMTKSWGERAGLQPIQYVNEKSPLITDFREAFTSSIEAPEDVYNDVICSYLQTHMFYIKPVKGKNKKRTTDEIEEKYLTDECEWRYIPNLNGRLPHVLFDRQLSVKNSRGKLIIDEYNDLLRTPDYKTTWLPFEYIDVKYIIVNNNASREEVIEKIMRMTRISRKERLLLVSKIVLLDDALEDF